jgi:hypothetical protein
MKQMSAFRVWIGVPGLLLLGGIDPLLPAIFASALAQHAGCQLDEGSVHACVVLGADRGATLYGLFACAWFAILTAPLGVLACLGWLITAVVVRDL